MQYKAFEKGIEVNGQTVYAVVDGFTHFKRLPSRFLLEEGIGQPRPDGTVHIVAAEWYSQEAWLRAFERISNEVGASTLYSIGLKIPENAIFPPWVTDVDSAIRSINIAYHLNHRKAGQVMFDPNTGTILEGIGSYGYERAPDRNQIVSVCANPYPCEFDRGIITAMARRFAPRAAVLHDDHQPCRQGGAESCTYVVTW